MKRTDLESVYAMACAAKGFKPNDDQFRLWWKILHDIERSDLESAMIEWFTAHIEFPMPADLLPLVRKGSRVQAAIATTRTTYARWKCPECGIYQSGFIAPEDERPRRCNGIPTQRTDGGRICGALMVEVFREDNFTTGNKYKSEVA